ncbi:Uu.00g118910.m01.CDS01 [Anthostomella pinea]|uniref:Uu.00g118910.m01.CDS01 n=1 Tax=Anthostomella pinea TaxID=933095 RepID=A0AAI8VGJ6_9PEZI|nr:Uu.00g118910.m01.CDS01 [Anthostomella pinea]
MTGPQGREAVFTGHDQSNGNDMPSTPQSEKPVTSPPQSPQELPPAERPQNWAPWRKWTYTAVVAYCDCLTFLVSMMLAPSVPLVLKTFRPNGDDKALGSFSVRVYILGFCTGPLVLAPLTDLYGRKPVLLVSSLFFAALTAACGLAPSLESLIAFRFFAGCFGGAPMAVGGAVVADVYLPGRRGAPMAFYSAGTMMGPTIGPVLGGVTHLPTLIRRHHQKPKRWSRLWSKREQDGTSVTDVLVRTISLPARIAFSSPPCAAILLMIMIFNGLVNIILSSLGSVYQHRFAFPPTTAGLAYLGIGFGGIMALVTAKRFTVYLAARLSDVDTRRPEHVLPFLWFTIPLGSAGLLWYGWALQNRSHWIVPILGLAPFGYGYMSLATQLFMIEVTPDYSASALAAHTVASSIGGAVIPLATFPLYDGVGYGWGNSVIALVMSSLMSIPICMYLLARSGGRWRAGFVS